MIKACAFVFLFENVISLEPKRKPNQPRVIFRLENSLVRQALDRPILATWKRINYGLVGELADFSDLIESIIPRFIFPILAVTLRELHAFCEQPEFLRYNIS